MLKREIKYENFDGEEAVDVFYFNISKPELIEMEVEFEGGFSSWIQKIVESKDHKTLIQQFKRIVLLAYGEKSDDGKRFIKNDKMREEFSQTAAYEALFMELATNDGAAATFLLNVMPKDMRGQIEAGISGDKPASPPLKTV